MISNKNNVYFVSCNKNTLIFIRVSRIAGLLWATDEQDYKGFNDEPVNFGVHCEKSFSIVYGVCSDVDINLIQLKLKNDEIFTSNLNNSNLFALKYNDDSIYWSELIAYNKLKDRIWIINN